MIRLESKISELYRVGAATAKTLSKLGLVTVSDLLFYLPYRYEDFSLILPISDLQPDTSANAQGTIQLIQNRRSAKRRLYVTEALLADESDTLKLIWFNQPFLTKNLRIGDRLSVSGRVSLNHGQTVMVSPQYEKIYGEDRGLVHTQGLVPNYHLTANITQKQVRALVKQAVALAPQVKDWLPGQIKERLGLMDLAPALSTIHFPKDLAEARRAQQRLAFTELFLRQLKAQITKHELKSRQAPMIKFQENDTKKFVSSLPYGLTDDQKKAAWEILLDMEKGRPMNRLLEGDVGSGKTVVAVMALLNVALNRKQGALMVPTEILAEQHLHSLTELLRGWPVTIGIKTQSHKDKAALEADIVIGTHALIQDEVSFRDLALVIVDEQHRFGVRQRKRLQSFRAQGELTPHFLSMTATPIPRSLALAIYGDLDLSVIKQKPVGRKPIITKLITEENRQKAYDFIKGEIKRGKQAFVICPLIDPSDKLGTKSVKEEFVRLDKEIFPDIPVGLLHGKLRAKDKEKVMSDFLSGKTKILVSTSVVEVGVDVPNATIMMIEGAERFGLASLHQFRGRVGRAGDQSYCFLFPSADEGGEKTIERLKAMTKYDDGFMLARIDLKLRGAGELYGTGQSGFPELQLGSLFDFENIKKAQAEAARLITEDPDLSRHPVIKEKLGHWEEEVHLE